MMRTLSDHWPEYLCEAFGLALFMMSAAVFAVVLEHPASPVHDALPDPLARRALMGIAMGLTGILNVYSPWGRRSGCHLNPAVTLTFAFMGKVAWRDAMPYIVAQFVGGTLGLVAAGAVLRGAAAHPDVHWVVTSPGPQGVAVAFAAEACISFGLMTLVLCVGNSRRAAPFTGICVGLLVALYITFEAPLSGMSMNPARTLASAWPSRTWTGLWVYFTAPLLGMGAAALMYHAIPGLRAVACAKLHHDKVSRCIFRCSFQPRTGHD